MHCIVIVPDAIECVTQGISKHKEDPAMYERQRERDPHHRRCHFFWGTVVVVGGAFRLFFSFFRPLPQFPPPVDLVN